MGMALTWERSSVSAEEAEAAAKAKAAKLRGGAGAAAVSALKVGDSSYGEDDENSEFVDGGPRCAASRHQWEVRVFLIALFSVSMAFYLFSYQVHEKTVLLPALPISLLAGHPGCGFAVICFNVLATFSMFPLLVLDGLQLAYVACVLLYVCVAGMCNQYLERDHIDDAPVLSLPRCLGGNQGMNMVFALLVAGAAVIQFLVVVDASIFPILPASLVKRFPDLHAVMVTTYSCVGFIFTWLVSVYSMYAYSGGTSKVDSKADKSELEAEFLSSQLDKTNVFAQIDLASGVGKGASGGAGGASSKADAKGGGLSSPMSRPRGHAVRRRPGAQTANQPKR